MSNISKAKHAFDERFYRFDEDIELVDYLSGQIRSGVLSPKGNLFPGDVSKYERLNKRSQNKKGQALSNNRTALITHLKQTLYASYIKDSYEEVTDYLKVVLKNAAISKTVNIKQFVGGQSKLTISASEILEAGDFVKLTQSLIDKIFQELEKEKSTLELIKTVFDKLGMKKDNKLINKSVNYLNIRHYLVHSDGRLPDDFKEKLKENSVNFTCDSKGFLKLNYELIKDFRVAVSLLVEHIDNQLISGDFLDARFVHLNRA